MLVAVLLCGFALFGAPLGVAQAPQAVTEPDYANSFLLLAADGHLEPLERKPVGVMGKVKAFGFGGADVLYQIQDEHSTVRRPAGAPLDIVVRLENQDVDPATLVVLYPLKVVKGQRQLLISGARPFSGHTKSDLQSKQLQMNFSKYGQKSVKITPQTPLAPGEYAITVQTQNSQPTAYCFGIDEAK
jgi:hypothetical protein